MISDRARAVFAIVVTKDRNFVESVSRRGPLPQIVWLTCGNTSNTHRHGILSEAWPRAAALLQAGASFGSSLRSHVM